MGVLRVSVRFRTRDRVRGRVARARVRTRDRVRARVARLIFALGLGSRLDLESGLRLGLG